MLTHLVLTALVAQASPAPTPTSACLHDAQFVKAARPDFHPESDETQLAATVLVVVAADGSVKKATISKSSGNLQFDRASVRAARQSTYKPKVVDCEPIEGTVIFQTTFSLYAP